MVSVASVTYADARHASWASGLILALMAGGAFVGGVVYGRRPRHGPPHRRLVLLMALATVLAICLGTAGLKGGQRRRFEGRKQRQLSVFQLGLRILKDAVTKNRFIECRLCLHPV